VSSRLRGCKTKTTGGKGSANTSSRQQVGVCRAYTACGSVVIEKVIKKGVEVSRLSGAESVVGQRGKFESYALLNRKPKYSAYNTQLHPLGHCHVGLLKLPQVTYNRTQKQPNSREKQYDETKVRR